MNAGVLAAVARRHQRPLVLSGLIFTAYVGAIARGESFLWVMAALLLATLVAGVSWPHWLVRQLTVARRGPDRAHEGDRITFSVEIENRGRLPRFILEVVDRMPFMDVDSNADATHEKVLGVVSQIAGGSRKSFEVSVPCEKRGRYQLGPVKLASSFPLGLVEARQVKGNSLQNLTIYPVVLPIVTMPLHGAPSQIHRGAFLLPEAAGAAEFCGLREYRRGDNPRHIHWPTSARTRQLMVKEFEPLASASLCLILDLAADSNVGRGRHSTLEYAIKIAASVARYATRNGMPVRLITGNPHSMVQGAALGEFHFQNILEELAIADAFGSEPYSQLLERSALDCEWGETVVVFLSEPVTRIDRTLEAVALLRSRGAHVLGVSFDRASFLPRAVAEPATPSHIRATLLELNAAYVHLRNGDNIFKSLNP